MIQPTQTLDNYPDGDTQPVTQTLDEREFSALPRRSLAHRTRVMHVTLGTQVGGMEKLLVEFAKFVDRSRFELSFASLQARGQIAEQIESNHCPVFEFHKREGVRPLVVARLAHQLRKSRTQVVHTHNTAAFFYGVLAAKIAGVRRIIHTRHGQRFGASRRETALFYWLSKLAHRIVSVSEDGRQLSLSEGVPSDRLVTILNGIDLRKFAFAGSQPMGPAVLVARLSPEKDVASLLNAIPTVLRMLGPKAQGFSLNIVGDGSTRCHLETLAQELHLAQHVKFLGHCNNVPEILAEASMFVLPSLTEGVSLTLLEAMARGLPVVATRVGGTPEVVVDGQTGLLIPPQSPHEIAGAIVQLYQDPSTAQRMGKLGRQRVEQQFSIERMIKAYQAQYLDEALS